MSSSKFFKSLKVNVEHEPQNERFLIPFSPRPVSLSYRATEGGWEITKVEVSQDARKLRMGNTLMEYVLETAKRDKINVWPACSYAKHFFARFPRYQELMPK